MNLQLIVISAIFIVIAFFIPMPLEAGAFYLFVQATWLIFCTKREIGLKMHFSEIKGMWQEKLGQLDSVACSIRRSRRKTKKLH